MILCQFTHLHKLAECKEPGVVDYVTLKLCRGHYAAIQADMAHADILVTVAGARVKKPKQYGRPR